MDGNMLEAIREKENAEMMMISDNYSGARDKLLKAKNLCPKLDNITGMLTVCDILCAANVRISGYSTDWYWILQLKPDADESKIEIQFCELIKLLEPIKSKFPGTVSALKLIKDAFFVLSDRKRRAEFDKNRLGDCWAHGSGLQEQPDIEVVKRKTESNSESSSGKMRIDGNTFDVNNELSFSRKTQKMTSSKGITESGVQDAVICTEEEVLKDFSVFDEPRKKIRVQETGWVSSCMGTGSNRGAGVRRLEGINSKVGSERNPSQSFCKMLDSDYYNFNNDRKAEAFSVGQVWAAYDQEKMPRCYYRIRSFTMLPFQLQFTCLKPIPGCADEESWCKAGLPVSCGAFQLDMNSMMVGGASKFSHVVSKVAAVTDQPVEIYPRKGEVWAIYKDWKPFDWCADPNTRKGYRLLMVEILTSFSKQEGVVVACLEKVDGFRNIFQRCTDNRSNSCFPIRAAYLYTFSHMVPAFQFVGGEMNGISAGMFELDPLTLPVDSSSTCCPSITTAIMPEPEGEEALESQCTRKHFVPDQIWAIYDGPDSLPQQYVRIENLISRSEVCVTFLKPYPILEDEILWVKENLPFVCGIFRADGITSNLKLSRFSHLVKCDRSKDKSSYRVYPKKGDTWAVYKNWNRKWTRSNFNSSCCRIVQVLSDFSEESGLGVASLVEVPGFLTFFHRQLEDGYELLRTVSRMEMLSFSHQIPAFIVLDIETYGLPKGSLHLEPNALPSALSMRSIQP